MVGMYVPVWLIVLVLAPWLLYLVIALATLLGASALLGVATLADGLGAPARRLGPWVDYVAATGVLVILVALAALLS